MKEIEKIWQDYHNKLYAFIRNRVSDKDAEDILQDVFIKIHARIDSLKDDSRLESWLYQITRNTIIDYYRARERSEKLPDWIEHDHPKEDDLIIHELSACFAPMIKKLPDKYRAAVQLSEIEGKTQKEVAVREKISLSGAKSRVQRGRVLLKSMLLDCCHFEFSKSNRVIDCEHKDGECNSCE